MAKPRKNYGTCRHCDAVVVWRPLGISEDQQAENAKRLAEGEPRWKLHHAGKPRWTHEGEVDGGPDETYCPTLREKAYWDKSKPYNFYWTGPQASPKEFCNAVTNDGGLCNRTASESVDNYFYCGSHFAPLKKEAEQRELHRQDRAVRDWMRAESVNLAKYLTEHYHLPAEAYNRYGEYDGKMLVDGPALVRLLEEAKEWQKGQEQNSTTAEDVFL